MSQNKRTDGRLSFQRKCTLSGLVNSRAVDVSKLGLGVLINDLNIPIRQGDKLFVHIKSVKYHSLSEVRWTKEDANSNSTRVGLKLSCPY